MLRARLSVHVLLPAAIIVAMLMSAVLAACTAGTVGPSQYYGYGD